MLIDQSGRIWAMRFDQMAVQEAISLRKDRDEDRVLSIAGGAPLDGSDFARVTNGVAVVPVRGMLLRSMNYWFWSYEEIQRDVALALASDEVGAVILDVDSPGGYSAGVGDLAAWLRDQGAAKDKPIHAFVGGMAASAAYNIASATHEIGMGSSSAAGSIGTVIEYVDVEPMWEKLGAKMVRVVAEQSPNKRLDPHSEEGRAEMQALVDAGAAEFIASVAAGRNVSEDTVLSDFGQGLVFDSSEAIRRGMADRRITLHDMIAELAGRDNAIPAVPAAAEEESPMNWESITSAALREHCPGIVTEIEDAATAAANTDRQGAIDAAAEAARTAERERIMEIDEIAVAGHEDLVSAAKADGKTTAAQLALQIVKADKAAGGTMLSSRESDDDSLGVPPAPQSGSGPAAPASGSIEDRAKAAWNKDADLRAEFGDDFDTYLAFAKAEESGQARVKRPAA